MKQRDSNSAAIYNEILFKMSPEKRLLKAFELSEFAKQLFKCGLRKKHPNLSEKEFHAIFIKEFSTCHNRNY
ncbi:MAG: hypothetical protein A3H98_03335 [Bacteroidetes bacterium RIFCSPLOWO2_02_FULL_36_8]|nr:MAG: hypothetical protein A3H98_03335 [Bacteroidetes bacterium RIFCSPLOWO2_02_FULL_36_8]OFY71863.1 MAG: hypothetical protein A3G23_04880 [Bacteroidetes bacterium RIFCSPLOWO2_12_FULL_37_12]